MPTQRRSVTIINRSFTQTIVYLFHLDSYTATKDKILTYQTDSTGNSMLMVGRDGTILTF